MMPSVNFLVFVKDFDVSTTKMFNITILNLLGADESLAEVLNFTFWTAQN